MTTTKLFGSPLKSMKVQEETEKGSELRASKLPSLFYLVLKDCFVNQWHAQEFFK